MLKFLVRSGYLIIISMVISSVHFFMFEFGCWRNAHDKYVIMHGKCGGNCVFLQNFSQWAPNALCHKVVHKIVKLTSCSECAVDFCTCGSTSAFISTDVAVGTAKQYGSSHIRRNQTPIMKWRINPQSLQCPSLLKSSIFQNELTSARISQCCALEKSETCREHGVWMSSAYRINYLEFFWSSKTGISHDFTPF